MPPSTRPWRAPVADVAVDATVRLPGSKSVTNRALVLAALSDGPSTVTGALRARDTSLMIGALRALGIGIEDDGDALRVNPVTVRGPAHVDCGLAGTVMRFVPPVAALASGDVRFDGDPRARVRPMAAIVDGLEQLGVAVDDDGRGTLPFTVRGSGSVRGGRVVMDASASSQFVSALLLSAARFDDGVVVQHQGAPVPSLPHIEMTLAMLAEHGVTTSQDLGDLRDCRWSVSPGPVRALDRDVEPDLSNAAAFLAAAVVTGGTVRVPGWPSSTTQAGDALRDLLAAAGADVVLDADGLTVTGPGAVRGLDVDLHDVGELAPVLAAVCALAGTPSRLRGIGHLRGHETDRLAALAAELTGLGGRVRETEDGLAIDPAPLRGGRWRCYDDHRMAMAGAVVGLVVPGVELDDVGTTAKTLPTFEAMWAHLLGTTPEAATA